MCVRLIGASTAGNPLCAIVLMIKIIYIFVENVTSFFAEDAVEQHQ